MAWQPIATAPIDRYILVWSKGYVSPKSARWNRFKGCFTASLDFIGVAAYPKATHWHEMPEPPRD